MIAICFAVTLPCYYLPRLLLLGPASHSNEEKCNYIPRHVIGLKFIAHTVAVGKRLKISGGSCAHFAVSLKNSILLGPHVSNPAEFHKLLQRTKELLNANTVQPNCTDQREVGTAASNLNFEISFYSDLGWGVPRTTSGKNSKWIIWRFQHSASHFYSNGGLVWSEGCTAMHLFLRTTRFDL